MSSQAGTSGGGGLLLVVVFVGLLLFVLAGAVPMEGLDGDVVIQERADNHVAEKHGTKARDVVTRNDGNPREYSYSATRRAVMVAKCDTANCACMIIGSEGMPFGGGAPFNPSWLNGHLELTSYFMSPYAYRKALIEGNYTYLGTW